ncbi:aminopeptidase [Sporosarcina luteola]|uniref:aminopeptidase n=1 Tax=Sporosarcina luteola TaxID=582850 RepID=UPI00203DEF95|nr:aminopeptidase [Sporosarcina luteola]MCM3744231.1 aminopeptidase [Sporosarcina luteola]
MRIENSIPVFLEFWESHQQPKLADLESYLNEHAEIYEKYFPIHCPKTEERLAEALRKYEGKIGDIRSISASLPGVIEELDEEYERTFGLGLDLSFKLMVGTFGSNAFVTRDNRREIYFAVEKLSAERDHLKVITAHEIGHVTHFALAARAGIDWSTVDWEHGLTTLFTEGAATYLSKRIVPGLQEPVYLSFDNEGAPWVKCYEENKAEVKRRFLEDALGEWDMVKEKEWFRLSGGTYFGYNRIGYTLGTDYVEQLVERIGEDAALTFWNGNDLKADILEWLEK